MKNTITTARNTRKILSKEAATTETQAPEATAETKFPVTDETTGITDCGPKHEEVNSMKSAEDKATGHVLPLPIGEGGAIVYVTKYLLTAIYASENGKAANKALRAENGAESKKKADAAKLRKDAAWIEVVRVGARLGFSAEQLSKAGVLRFWFLNKKTQKAICLSHKSEMGVNSLRTYINIGTKAKGLTMPQVEQDRREELLKIMLLAQFMASHQASADAFNKFAAEIGVDLKDIAAKSKAENEKEESGEGSGEAE